MAHGWAGPLGKAYVVLTYGGRRQGIVVELLEVELRQDEVEDAMPAGAPYQTYSPGPARLRLEGLVVSYHEAADAPDLDAPAQLTAGQRRLPERT